MVSIAFLASLLSCCHWKTQSEASCKSNDDIVGKTTMLASALKERVPHQFLIIAHKGYSSAHQENSLNAFEAAIDAGADVIEADVRESADGTPSTLSRRRRASEVLEVAFALRRSCVGMWVWRCARPLSCWVSRVRSRRSRRGDLTGGRG